MVRPIFQPRRAVHVRRTRTRHRIRIENQRRESRCPRRPQRRGQRERSRVCPGAAAFKRYLCNAAVDGGCTCGQDAQERGCGCRHETADGGGNQAELRQRHRGVRDLRRLRDREQRHRLVQPDARRRRREALQYRPALEPTVLREDRPRLQTRRRAEGALHRSCRRVRRQLPAPRGRLALARRRGVLQPGHGAHALPRERPHDRRRPHATPPVRRRARRAARLFRHQHRHPGFAASRVAVQAAHLSDAGDHRDHPKGAERRHPPRG